MSLHISLPSKLVYDRKLSDGAKMLYAVIADNCNEHGYSEIRNGKLDKKNHSNSTGIAKHLQKQESQIRTLLNDLEKHGYITVKTNVKQNDIYPRFMHRVIWIKEYYNDYRFKKQQALKKRVRTKENDYQAFLLWLRTDLTNINIPIDLGGLAQNYQIHDDQNLYLHATGEGALKVAEYISKDAYLKMWRKRENIFKYHGTDESESYKAQLLALNAVLNTDTESEE